MILGLFIVVDGLVNNLKRALELRQILYLRQTVPWCFPPYRQWG